MTIDRTAVLCPASTLPWGMISGLEVKVQVQRAAAADSHRTYTRVLGAPVAKDVIDERFLSPLYVPQVTAPPSKSLTLQYLYLQTMNVSS